VEPEDLTLHRSTAGDQTDPVEMYCDAAFGCGDQFLTREECLQTLRAKHDDDSGECQEAWLGFLRCSAGNGQCSDVGPSGPTWRAGAHCSDNGGWYSQTCPQVVAVYAPLEGEGACDLNMRCAGYDEAWLGECRAVADAAAAPCKASLLAWEQCLLDGGECRRYSDGEVEFYAPERCELPPADCRPVASGVVEEWEWISKIAEPE
jgi:hypothetical protein